jgi:hypothetical protein
MNKKIRKTIMIALVLGISQSALADHICDADITSAIGEIKSQYGDEQFLGKRASYDADGLIDKLDAAMGKLHYGKSSDANDKVLDAQYKLDQMVGGKRKLTNAGYDEISSDIDDVLACIEPFLPAD